MRLPLFLLLAGATYLIAAPDRPGALLKKFKSLDRDNDGRVSAKEADNAPWFKILDGNGDGFITLEEARERFVLLSQPDSSPSAPPVAAPQGPKILKPGDVGIGRMIAETQFVTLAGQSTSLRQLAKERGLVIAFTSTTCPVSKRYTPSLSRLESDLGAKKMPLLLVNPMASEKPDALLAMVKEVGWKSPYLHDREHLLAQALQARTTTEVFLLDSSLTLVYRGALDDQYGIDYSRDTPSVNYLQLALEAWRADTRPLFAATEAPGCELDLGSPALSSSSPNYHRDVARILQQNCAECHREKGIAPFSLEDLEEVKDRAKVIQRVVQNGTMPPWFAEPAPAGQPNPWANDRSLSERDKSDLLSWLKSSERPLGAPELQPTRPKSREGWSIAKPDLIIQIPQPIVVKADGFMPYQIATVDTQLTEDKWVQAYEILPTAREVVHHVIVRVHEKGSANKADRGEGSDGYWAAYVPGNTFHTYPTGFARKLPAGSTIRFEIHYTPNGKATSDQMRMGLVYSQEPPKFAVHTVAVANPRLSIPPGESNHLETAERKTPIDLQITALVAHMHVRGKSFKYEVTYPDGHQETLLNIPRYDFNWQLRYEFKEPHFIPRGSTVKITAGFDNSPANKANPDPTKTVHWGQQTFDEMMIGYIEHFTPLAPSVAALSPAH